MSVTTMLLDTLLAPLGPWRLDEQGALVLTVGLDVIVNLVENETDEVVHIFSAAGYCVGTEVSAVDLNADAAGEGQFSVHVAQHSGLVLMLRTLARAQLDELTFRKELASHVDAVRTLASVLSENPSEPDIPGTEEPPHWLACPPLETQTESLRLTLPGRAKI
jgi:hypothetical protein